MVLFDRFPRRRCFSNSSNIIVKPPYKVVPIFYYLRKFNACKNTAIREYYCYYEKVGSTVKNITDEIPFDIPTCWNFCRLKDICSKIVDGDHNPPKGVDYETKYMMLSSQNINNDRIVSLDKVRYLTKDIFEIENERTKLLEGDILFTSVGTLGRTCIYQGGLNLCFQRSVSIITTNIYNNYLKIFLDSPLLYIW